MNRVGLASNVGTVKLYVVKVTAELNGLPVDVAIVAGPYRDEPEAQAAGAELQAREPGEHFRVIGSVEDLEVIAR